MGASYGLDGMSRERSEARVVRAITFNLSEVLQACIHELLLQSY